MWYRNTDARNLTVGDFKKLLEERKVPDNVMMMNPYYENMCPISNFEVKLPNTDSMYHQQKMEFPDGVLEFWS